MSAFTEELADLGRKLDNHISHPSRMKVEASYGQARDLLHTPLVRMSPEWEARSGAEKWYLTPDELNTQSPPEFTAFDGTVIKKGADGSYINPYSPTGLKGPGILGVSRDEKGRPIPESRGVDIVIQFIDPSDGKLKIIGGFRRDTGQPCFIAGFLEKGALESAVREFLEEGVSGSIDLQKVAPDLKVLCDKKSRREPLTTDDEKILGNYGIRPSHFTGDVGEATYHFIKKEDPALVEDLTAYFKSKLEVAYKGRIHADPRTTDDRWIATSVLTGLVNLEEIQKLLSGRKHAYRFAAGSDLKDVAFHPFGPEFVMEAFASDGPLSCRATAHNLAKLQTIPPTVLAQCQEVMSAIRSTIAPESDPVSSRPGLRGILTRMAKQALGKGRQAE